MLSPPQASPLPPRLAERASKTRDICSKRANSTPPASDTYSDDRGQAALLTHAERNAFYAEFTPLVRRLIKQYGNHVDTREDLNGVIFCYFNALLEAYDPARGVPLRPYLIRQLSACIYTYARQQWRRTKRCVNLKTDPLTSKESLEDPTRQWDTLLMREQWQKALPSLIAGLTLRQRQVVVWRYYEQRSFEEIATALNIKPATARSLLRHALLNLRKAMSAEFGDL